MFTQSPELLRKMSLLRNFGHTSPTSFEGIGINGKNSEFHAAMGLANLKHIEEILLARKKQWQNYRHLLRDFKADHLAINERAEFNHAYYPLIFSDEAELLRYMQVLQDYQIYARRYFYPSLNRLDYVAQQAMPHSENISSRILCLPLYHELTEELQHLITRILLRI